jgi:hypothetical protein
MHAPVGKALGIPKKTDTYENNEPLYRVDGDHRFRFYQPIRLANVFGLGYGSDTTGILEFFWDSSC